MNTANKMLVALIVALVMLSMFGIAAQGALAGARWCPHC